MSKCKDKNCCTCVNSSICDEWKFMEQFIKPLAKMAALENFNASHPDLGIDKDSKS